MIKKFFGLAIGLVIGLGTIAVAVPTPQTSACLWCVPIDCPPLMPAPAIQHVIAIGL